MKKFFEPLFLAVLPLVDPTAVVTQTFWTFTAFGIKGGMTLSGLVLHAWLIRRLYKAVFDQQEV